MGWQDVLWELFGVWGPLGQGREAAREGWRVQISAAGSFPGVSTRTLFKHTFLPVKHSPRGIHQKILQYSAASYFKAKNVAKRGPSECQSELVLGGVGLCTINDTGMTCLPSKNQIWKVQNLISGAFFASAILYMHQPKSNTCWICQSF